MPKKRCLSVGCRKYVCSKACVHQLQENSCQEFLKVLSTFKDFQRRLKLQKYSEALKLSSCTSALRQIALCTNKNREKYIFHNNCMFPSVKYRTNNFASIFMLKSASIFSVPGSSRYLRRAKGSFQGSSSLAARLRCQVKIADAFHSLETSLHTNDWG